ncbi:MAG: AtpZ/AtpI family protein [Lachnospiraceae bacterium]|nr:AtpZ/AtpI family protein [Lachnospiraceae bacterium]
MKQEVFKTWTLVLQLGISILVPIFLLVALGYILREKLNIDVMLICIILGVLVGVINTYAIIKNYLKMMDSSKNKESELMKKHRNSLR